MPSNNPNLSDVGSERSDYIKAETENIFEEKVIQFRLKCIDLINERGVSASGKLIDSIGQPEIVQTDNSLSIKISMADYYDYTNKGVKGWKDSSKAPNSPYQYKTKGMNEAGKKSIEEYVRSGAKKVTTFSQSYKELESKFSQYKGKKKLIDFQIANAIFGIKAKGIKAKHWFDDAVKEVFGDFEQVLAEVLGDAIKVTINLKGNK